MLHHTGCHACIVGLALAWGVMGCGGDSPQCQTKSTVLQICNEDVLYRCPIGAGEWVDMVQVQDCAAKGQVCHDPLTADPSCKDPGSKDSIVGPDAAQYSEKDDAANDDAASAEATGYTLDDKGIVISASLGTDDVDHYVFGAGSMTRLDVQVFVDGVKQDEANHTVTIAIDAVEDDGYSVLRGNGYFINAGLPNANKDYVLSIRGTNDQPYTIEMKGNPE